MVQLHATTIAVDGRGLLILGPSGAGKSCLALQMMAAGAALVADDRTDVTRDGAALIASCPAPLRGRIEARGVGILAASDHGPVQLAAIADLGRSEADRLPKSQEHDLLGIALPLVLGPYRPHLYAALRQLLVAGRVA
ncbi:serine kinase [Paracoccus sp. R12_1]|uniref:HPr kinase/phosphorylase n=1 Tax=unclassified Paracoccus (in: a-proteobacteria) TaxID=2688777 RepID=UPI001ADA2802|nr:MULTISPECIES: serine kinase [unclassified Paracoccus (in: a-proteobacteria)]MBO9457056.1 serine kinase [Paracoccus sp. R12_2]MBO9488309.1 serine kinase [Paracoccus sp. R12_1]